MADKHIGVCHICGKLRELTFEHIPPRKAFNWQRATLYNGHEALKKSKGEPSKYFNYQQGMGKYSLCENCNNITGSWYAQTYCYFTLDVIKFLHNNEPLNHGDTVMCKFNNFPALPIVKQVIAMFCSLLPYEENQRLGFDKLLLSKESNIVNKDLFDLRMYLTSFEVGQLMCGPTAVFYKNEKSIETVWVADLCAYPFGFILNLTPEVAVEYGVSIMNMFDVNYDDKCKFEMSLMYLERRSKDLPLPLMFKNLPNKVRDLEA